MPIDRIDSELWLIELSEFIEECDRSSAKDAELVLRRFASLVSVAPPPWARTVRPSITQQRLEQLLNAGAYESAGVGLLGPEFGYMLSRSKNGDCIGSVWLPSDEGENYARAKSEGIALVSACAASILRALSKTVSFQGQSPPNYHS